MVLSLDLEAGGKRLLRSNCCARRSGECFSVDR